MEVLQPFLFRIILICTDASIMEVSKVLSLCQEASFLPKWLSFCVCKKLPHIHYHFTSFYLHVLMCNMTVLKFFLSSPSKDDSPLSTSVFRWFFLLKMPNKVKSVDGVQVKNISKKAKNTGHWSEFSLHKNFKWDFEQNVAFNKHILK